MEVTKSNFQELLPEILRTINEANFLSVDGEFTGLNNENNISVYDTQSEYYQKLLNGALDFLLVQFGLSAFKYNPDQKKYTSKVYNFYIFPRPLNRQAPDQRFLCQSSSLNFLASNGFDFNKLFNEGIPYLTKKDEEALKESMAERRKYLASSLPQIKVPKHFKSQVNAACEKIGMLLSSDCTTEEVTVPKCGAFIRKLIYQTLEERYGKDKIEVETRQGVMIARKRAKEAETPEERQIMDKEKDEKEVDQAVGFSKVIRALAASEKLVVGHNMLLDLCHIVHHFCDPLPENYNEFKEMIHCLFPNLADTKFICSQEPLKELIKSSALEHVLQAVEDEPFTKPQIVGPEGYNYRSKTGKLHEAGYDAFITGICFISLHTYLQSEVGETSLLNDSKVLKPYLNKLCLMRTPDTYMDVEKDDPEPNRDHVFHLTLPKSWSNQNIAQLFTVYGGVQIHWLDSTSAWVTLFNNKEAGRVMTNLVRGKKVPKGIKLVPYSYVSKDSLSPRPNKRQTTSPPHPEILKRRRASVIVPEQGRTGGQSKYLCCFLLYLFWLLVLLNNHLTLGYLGTFLPLIIFILVHKVYFEPFSVRVTLLMYSELFLLAFVLIYFFWYVSEKNGLGFLQLLSCRIVLSYSYVIRVKNHVHHNYSIF